VLSKSIVVYCGEDTIRWCQILSKPWEHYPAVYVPSWVKDFEICRYRQALDFPRWIFIMGSTAASDPRDKVFAILGLFRGLEDAGLIPDYSLSISQVYIGVAAYLITRHNMRHILAINQTPAPDLPSWVPDWRCVNPTQWTANDKTPEHDFMVRSDRLRWRRLWLLGALNEPDSECPGDLGDLRDLFSEGRECHHNSTIGVHRHTGGLLISPEYMIPLDSFAASDDMFSLKWPWGWEFLSTSRVSTHEDYAAAFEGHKYWFLLRKVSKNQSYRIVGRCDLAIPVSEGHQLTSVKNILKAVKIHTINRKTFDTVQFWISTNQ
ncbi:hypothetical protein F4677DRAFT_459461, partial [Hypoxylon crocopeplum]